MVKVGQERCGGVAGADDPIAVGSEARASPPQSCHSQAACQSRHITLGQKSRGDLGLLLGARWQCAE